MARARGYWLVKSEPFKYSWDEFVADGITYWDGVRNYTARNNLQAMKTGDRVLYYHSNEGKEVVGVAKVTRESYPDPTTGHPTTSSVDLAFAYYSDGAVARRTDAKGNIFTYHHDDLGRLDRTEITTQSNYADEVTPTYPPPTPIAEIVYGYTPSGLLEQVTAKDGSETVLAENTLAYDGRQNLLEEAQSHDGAVDSSTPRVSYAWEYSPQSAYNFEQADTESLFAWFDTCEKESQHLIEQGLALPAYEMVWKASHTFNLLDARHAISVTERQRYILRVRTLSRAVAQAYYDAREALGFPICESAKEGN